MQLLRQKYYYATWKADGTRYMMMISREGVYLIDRNFRFRRVQLRFPLKVGLEFGGAPTLAEYCYNDVVGICDYIEVHY